MRAHPPPNGMVPKIRTGALAALQRPAAGSKSMQEQQPAAARSSLQPPAALQAVAGSRQQAGQQRAMTQAKGNKGFIIKIFV